VGGSELFAGVAAAALAAEPFAVEEAGACELGADAAAFEVVDRLLVEG
jgi:hypothetical protein